LQLLLATPPLVSRSQNIRLWFVVVVVVVARGQGQLVAARAVAVVHSPTTTAAGSVTRSSALSQGGGW